MRTRVFLVGIALLAVVLTACGEDRIHSTEGGGVLLSVSEFDGLPVSVSVNDAAVTGLVQIGDITVQNIIKDPTQPTSDLMNVEMDSYEIIYTRADTGTRVPPPLVRGILGVAPVGGTEQYSNLPILTAEQLFNAPLSDLLFQNGAFDKETGQQVISLNLSLRFYGRTVSGEAVDSAPATFTVDFLP